ncbi:MAG: RloB family protein [Paramuribaculum sp.]|nr:RloB family protein [Paramuribaculum sp.]
MRTRRYKKSRPARRLFLVICEGETEKNYVEALKQEYRLPISIKTKVSGQSINLRLVNQYIRELDLTTADEYRIFYIYDRDVKEIADRLSSLPGTAILTNPCIELWFLIHLKDCTKTLTSDEVVKALVCVHENWKSYSKGNLSKFQIQDLTNNRNLATARAALLKIPDNPSSNFPDFIEALEKEKNS